MRSTVTLVVALALAAIAGGAALAAGEADRQPAQKAAAPAYDAAAEDAKAREYFTDAELVDQNGGKLRFYSDVLRGKTVLVSMFYTSCKDACPLVNAALQQVQAELGDQVGKDITLISITVDPEIDTPEVIASYAQKFEPGDGWHFLTGDPDTVHEIVRRLGHAGQVEMHTSLLIMGNVPERVWTRTQPSLPPAALAMKLRDLAKGGFRNTDG